MEQALKRETVYIQRILQIVLATGMESNHQEGADVEQRRFLVEQKAEIGGKMHTIDDILALPEGERAELIDGEMFMMATPTRRHQKTTGWLYAMIFNHIMERKGRCEVDISPFAVFLKNDRWNYVEPDVIVVCDREKLDDKGCHGAPDWAIEVVSPSSVVMDYRRKLEAYKSAGVKEYWIVDLEKETVSVYDFTNDQGGHDQLGHDPMLYSFFDKIKSGIIKDLELDFASLSAYLA